MRERKGKKESVCGEEKEYTSHALLTFAVFCQHKYCCLIKAPQQQLFFHLLHYVLPYSLSQAVTVQSTKNLETNIFVNLSSVSERRRKRGEGIGGKGREKKETYHQMGTTTAAAATTKKQTTKDKIPVLHRDNTLQYLVVMLLLLLQ